MANVISLSKQITTLFEEPRDMKSQLGALSLLLKAEAGVQVFFCELVGPRWAFFAGDITLDIPQNRVPLNDHWGMMTGEIELHDELWQDVVATIKHNIENR